MTRFVWLKDISDPSVNNDNLREYRFTRVPFGVVSSPFLLGATVEHHLDTYDSAISENIKIDIYVDNLVTGSDSVEQAILYIKIPKVCSMLVQSI